MIRDISDVAHNVKHVTKHNAEIIASEIPGWTGTNSGTLLTPIANTTSPPHIQGVLLENTIIKGTDNSGLTIGDVSQNLGSYPAYHIAMGMSGEMSAARAAHAGFMYRDRSGNTFVFDSGGCKDGGRLLINGHPVGAHDAHFSVSGDLLVQGTIESSGVILQPIHSAEGSTQSAVTDLDPSTNPLMSKGMLWINKAQEGAGAATAWTQKRITTCAGPGASWATPTAANWYSVRYIGSAVGADPSSNGSALGYPEGKIFMWNWCPLGTSTGYGRPNAFSTYDIKTDSWATNNGGIHMGPPTNPNGDGGHGGNLVILDNKLYAIGGLLALYRDGAGAGAASASTKCFAYDPTLGAGYQWSGIASMKHGRFAAGAAAMGGKIYVLGGTAGWEWPEPAWPENELAEVYDPNAADPSWSTIPWMSQNVNILPAPPPLAGQFVVGVSGRLYAIGGLTPLGGGGAGGTDTNIIGRAFYYAPTEPPETWLDPPGSSYWHEITPPNDWKLVARAGGACAVINNTIYMAGGITPSDNDNGNVVVCDWVTTYELPSAAYENGRWAWQPRMNIPVRGAIAVRPPTFVGEGAIPTSIPAATLGAAAAGKFYVVGGDGSGNDVLQIRDHSWTSAWSAIAPMDISRGGFFGCASLGGKIYVGGGEDDSTPSNFIASCEVYDPTTNSWSAIASLSNPLVTGGRRFVALRGKLYAVDGVTATQASPPLGEVYDPSTNIWTAMAPMLNSRSSAATAALGGKLYVVGGVKWDGHSEVPITPGEVYDPLSKTWAQIAASPNHRKYATAAALGGKLYVACGIGVTAMADFLVSSVDVYDPATNSWDSIAPTTMPRDIGAVAFALGGKLYVAGGYNSLIGGPGMYSVEVYDPMNPNGGWTQSTTMSEGRWYPGVAVLGGKLYAGGGGAVLPSGAQYEATNSFEVYDPSLVQMPQITYQGEDFYVSAQRGGPKTFVIQHPEHEGKKLRHACLEAPTRGTNVYEYQFEATEDNQTTEIELPSYFKLINGRPRVYVYYGAGSHWGRSRGYMNDDLTKTIIETEKSGTYNVMVTGVRKDPEAVAYSATENIDAPIDEKDI